MSLFPVKPQLTPDLIMNKLSNLYEQSHFNHFQTTSYASHKALSDLYEGVIGFKDKIGELLLGYIAPRRFSGADPGKVDPKKGDVQLVNEGIQFSKELYEYGEANKWWELSNHAADLEGLFTTTKYFLTLI